ncbi:transposase family protein [Streptomyces sp. NPDC057456]|uniref:helix-turn-helix domain-containing protein n=1 Tax=Streptomyces sp. NPDC057456 TaxID=3346139 RepID=UPI00369C092C
MVGVGTSRALIVDRSGCGGEPDACSDHAKPADHGSGARSGRRTPRRDRPVVARAARSRSRVASPSPGRGCRAVGAGAKHKLVFVDRLLVTLVHLRHGATHDVLACWFGVDRSTITRAIGEVRPLLAMRGCTVATDVRLRTLAEVIDHHGASGQRPGSSTAPRSGSVARLPDARTGRSSPPARTSRTPEVHGRHGH